MGFSFELVKILYPTQDKDTFVEYGSIEDALKAYQAMSGAEKMQNLHPTKELRRIASSRLPRLTEE